MQRVQKCHGEAVEAAAERHWKDSGGFTTGATVANSETGGDGGECGTSSVATWAGPVGNSSRNPEKRGEVDEEEEVVALAVK